MTRFDAFGPNSGFVEELFALYSVDASLVSADWADYFSRVSHRESNGGAGATVVPAPLVSGPNGLQPSTSPVVTVEVDEAAIRLHERVGALIRAFRARGHFAASVNPLSTTRRDHPTVQELSPEYHGILSGDLDETVRVEGGAPCTVRQLIERYTRWYCGPVGFDIDHVTSDEERDWLLARIEGERHIPSPEVRRKIFEKLIAAESLESELHKRYVGSKRFSVEGGETFIPVVDVVFNLASDLGSREVIVGMAHRGRLGLLAHVFGKPVHEIFAEFEDTGIASVAGSGDVKYHLGFEGRFSATNGEGLEVILASNPSHLEAVNPVVLGMVRAIQDRRYGGDRKIVLPLLVHGDAALIGQGVVAESFNLALTDAYSVGGTIHIVINNQVGFTTDPDESRSSPYCTDGGKGFGIPVFHVNAEDPDSACWAARLATEYRATFGKDVIIDLYCYRKYGHNEGDDPTFTQPRMYAEIKSRTPIAKLYSEILVRDGVISSAQVEELSARYDAMYREAHEDLKRHMPGEACPTHGRVRGPEPTTKVQAALLKGVARRFSTFPEGFTPHPKLQKILEKRVESVESGSGIEWGFAEVLAYGSLISEGKNVRLSGQDCGRGTFSHRHAVLHDYEKDQVYLPLDRIGEAGGRCEIFNSTLSEFAVMGFEYGFSRIDSGGLILWEAQFGDFANGAQILIDQFLAASEAKWGQRAGLTLLLPHGYEGQGPEHSSARLERFLQLCAEGNMMVCMPSTAAQHFHLLRRQALQLVKRPLVVMTPKSLLRSADASATLDELTEGAFRETIVDEAEGGKGRTLFVTSGKLYYDLKAGITKAKKSASILRIEQLYPFPQNAVKKALHDVGATSVVWCQEEPQNMGAWTFVEPYFRHRLGINPTYVGRPVGASTAAGSSKRHQKEQLAIVDEVISLI